MLIDGKSDYSTNDVFSTASMVVIEYHSAKTIAVSISSEDVKYKSVEELYQLLEESGFTSINIEDVYDLDPDTIDAEFENEVSIDGVSKFNSYDKFPINANISIVHHLPFNKYTVQMHIDFTENLFFSKYDVDLIINEDKQHTMEHGTDADFTFELTEGQYTITFSSADSSSVKGQTKIVLESDVDVSYKISCYNDKVTVQTIYLDAKSEIADNEAKIMSSSTSFVGQNYKSVVSSLKELGFTNIKEIPIYDIIFGITASGSTKSVSIGGSKDYKRGDVFLRDIDIVVTYSLPYKDDSENKPGEPTTSESQTYRSESYARIKFNIPSSWNNKIESDGRMLYYPDVEEKTGFIQCNFTKTEIGNVNEAQAKVLLKGAIDNMVAVLQERLGNTQIKSVDYFKIGKQYAARVCCYSDIKFNDINDDRQMVNDTVIVLFDDGFSAITALFTPTEYEGKYISKIENTLSSVIVIDGGSTSTSELTPEEKEAIELAASKIIIELVIKEINTIFKRNVITDYYINVKTGYVSFNMSYEFITMSDDERQVLLNGINEALYSQIAGAGVPYSLYRYYVGGTVIGENKLFDPYSVKLK